MSDLVIGQSLPASTGSAYVYRFRAECEADVKALLALVAGRLVRFESIKVEPFPDTFNEVEVIEHSLDDMRGLCSRVVDGHVMLQTIQPKELYTGERDYEIRQAER